MDNKEIDYSDYDWDYKIYDETDEDWNLHRAISLDEWSNPKRDKIKSKAYEAQRTPLLELTNGWVFNNCKFHFNKHCRKPKKAIKTIGYFTSFKNEKEYAEMAFKAGRDGKQGYIKFCEDHGSVSSLTSNEEDRNHDMIFVIVNNKDGEYGVPNDSKCDIVVVVTYPRKKIIASYFPAYSATYDPNRGGNRHKYGFAKPWAAAGKNLFESLEHSSPVIEEIISEMKAE